MKKTGWLTLGFAFASLVWTCSSYAMTENAFENLLRTENAEIKALYERKEILQSNQEEAELIYGWQFIGGVNRRSDKRPLINPNFNYDLLETTSAQIGLQKQFSFGLETQLTVQSTRTEINNGNVGNGFFDAKVWETQPVLDLKLPLLAGGFGRKIRADYESNKVRLRLESLESEADYDFKMNEAKHLLWSTILQRELLASSSDTLLRIEKIYSIVQKKAAQNLEASSNFLQTRSALELAELELKNAQLRYSQLDRLLKSVIKNVSGIQVPTYNFNKFKKVDLVNYSGKVTAQVKINSLREDLQNQSAISASEINRSRLDLIASVALSGQDSNWHESTKEAQTNRYPTQFIGVQWVIPLDQGITSRILGRQSVLSKASLAKKAYYQSEKDQVLLQDLVAQYNQMIDMLALNLKLEKTQAEKLSNERKLLNQGRSSIYQVLQFELDLARSRAGKFSLALELEKFQQQLLQYRHNSYE